MLQITTAISEYLRPLEKTITDNLILLLKLH